MPKETIPDQAEQYDITVGWRRDHDVQVGITTHDGRSIAHNLGGEEDEFKALSGTLSREGVNRLIRDLRRARDQAYGRDE